MRSLDFSADELEASLPAGPVRRMYGRWLSWGGADRIPGRQHLHPEDFVADLPNVFLIDVLEGGRRLRYRLIGTNVVHWTGGDATGRDLDDAWCGDGRHAFIAMVQAVVMQRRPHLTLGQPAMFGGSARLFDRLMLPMARDGRQIDMVLGVADMRRAEASRSPKGQAVRI